MRKLRYFLEYLPILLFDCFFQLWSRSAAFKMGEGIGILFSFAMPSRKRLVIKNLTESFPEKSPQEIQQIAKKFWKHLGRVAVEFIRLSDINEKNWEQYYLWEGKEIVDRLKPLGRGVILVSFHFSNWEYLGAGVQFAWPDNLAIARPMKNPYVERWVQAKRSSGERKIIHHKNAVRAGLRTLKDNKSLGVFVDQNLYTGGVFVNFFGRPAASTTLPALLRSRTEAPIVMIYIVREGTKFKIILEPPLELPPIEEGTDWLRQHTQIITDQIERIIRTQPETWFWIHNRWKRKPGSPGDGSQTPELAETLET